MDLHYEFILDWQEQIFSHYRLALMLKNNHPGVRAEIFLKLSDVLIYDGSWLKSVAHSPVEENSINLSTQNT